MSCYLEEYLRKRQGCRSRREIVAVFCTSNKEHGRSIGVGHILSYITRQLLLRDDNRLDHAFQKHPSQRWIPAHPPLSFVQDYLIGLWGLILDLITASSECEVILILNGVNKIRPEEARETFLDNLVTLFNRVQSEELITIRVFVTAIPFEDIRRAFKDLPNIEKDKERQGYAPQTDLLYGISVNITAGCLRTLHFEEYNARENLVFTAKENTGNWILSHHAFETWDKSPNSSLLWLHGKPGSGKSTLAKQVMVSKTIESTQSMQAKSHNINPEKTTALEVDAEYVDHLATDRGIIVAAFFYSFRGGKTETSHKLMLRSMLYQILKENSKLFPSFQPTYRELPKSMGSPVWSYEDLKYVFTSLRSIQTPLKIYIIVDAMDESDEDRRHEILDFLSDLGSSKSACIFKVLIASRPYNDIQGHLNQFGHIILQNENRRDIETVVIRGVERLSDNQKSSRDKLNKVRDYLIDNSDGVFLWTSIVLKELQELVTRGYSQAELMGVLTGLPSDLVDLYKHIVKRLNAKRNPRQVAEGKKMLVWTAFAERPMTTEEFGDTVIISSDPEPFTSSSAFFSEARISHFERRIAHNCGGLLEVINIPMTFLPL